MKLTFSWNFLVIVLALQSTCLLADDLKEKVRQEKADLKQKKDEVNALKRKMKMDQARQILNSLDPEDRDQIIRECIPASKASHQGESYEYASSAHRYASSAHRYASSVHRYSSSAHRYASSAPSYGSYRKSKRSK